ncbi:flagellar protein FlaG [Selenomonas sp. KH1T6]|uniref:flagellar protein FlaG n=1 Tax=Selenomonas sp. KH1T6 TaxID=3158784 RepID=UPI0008A7FF29|nr:flagellar protein FlaG [Selenomonas ruminantium]
MIGKVNDMVSGAVVIGSMTQDYAAGTAAQRSQDQSSASAAPVDELQKAKQEEGTSVQETVEANAQKKEEPKEEDMQEMIKELNELMSRINCNLEFSYHKEVNVMSVKMIDKSTHEVIKELPPEEMIDNMIQAKDWIGAFLDKNA